MSKMKVREIIASLESSVARWNEPEQFSATLTLLRTLFSSFWAYPHEIPNNIYSSVDGISKFAYDFERGKRQFADVQPKEFADMQRKILILLGFFHQLFRTHPHISEFEIVQEPEVKASLRPLKLLVVCVGNVGRSPVLEQTLNFIIASVGLRLEVKSCGVFNLMGAPQRERAPQPFFTKITGRELSGASVPVSKELCDWADLVLTAAPYISNKIVQAFPSAKSKVVTAKEFVSGQDITEKGFSYAFYIDDPAFSVEREQALDKWVKEGKGSVKEFMKQANEDIKVGTREPFLYKGRYPEGVTARGEALSIKELLKIAFAIVEKLVNDNYLLTRQEYKPYLLFKLNNLRESSL